MPNTVHDMPLRSGFPADRQSAFDDYAARWLEGHDLRCRTRDTVMVDGETLQMPARVYMDRRTLEKSLTDDDLAPEQAPFVLALGSRHHDGYFRESCLRKLLQRDETWLLPYVLALLGEYVVEISQAILEGWSQLDAKALDRFSHDNLAYVARLRRRATSYWHCYYREQFPKRDHYPAWQALSLLPVPTRC